MKNALALEATAYDADAQVRHGEIHEQNAEEGGGQDKRQKVVNLTTCVMNTIFFCFALFASFVLNLCFSLSSTSKREGLFCNVFVFLRLCVFVLFQEFSGVLL